MTQKSKKQIEYTLTTHAIEKLTPSRKALDLCEQMAAGKISADSAVAALLKQRGLEAVRVHE